MPCFDGRNWKKIAEYVKGRTAIQCLHRWTKILQPGLVKGPWNIEEDRKLVEWIKIEGPTKWATCAEFISGRNGKQCRERWFNTLSPNVVKGNWSEEEDYNIFVLFNKYGSKWCQIANYFEGRTENSIKNRFYSTLRRIFTERQCIFDGCNDSFTNLTNVSSCSGSELLRFLPEALMEKSYKLAKFKGCKVSELMSYEATKNFDDLKRELERKGGVEKETQEDFKIPKLPKTLSANSKHKIGINIKSYNPIINMSINVNQTTPNSEEKDRNQTKKKGEKRKSHEPQTPTLQQTNAEAEFKNLSFNEMEQSILNSCNNENLLFTDPNFDFLDSQISNYIDNVFDTVKEEESKNKQSKCLGCSDDKNNDYINYNTLDQLNPINQNNDYITYNTLDQLNPINQDFTNINTINNKVNHVNTVNSFGNPVVNTIVEPTLNMVNSFVNVNEMNYLQPDYSKIYTDVNINLNNNNIFNQQKKAVIDFQKNVISSMQDVYKVENQEVKPCLGNLLQTLNDLEGMLQNTKSEIMKYENEDNKPGEFRPETTIDQLFKL